MGRVWLSERKELIRIAGRHERDNPFKRTYLSGDVLPDGDELASMFAEEFVGLMRTMRTQVRVTPEKYGRD